jgi:hypothetical protein
MKKKAKGKAKPKAKVTRKRSRPKDLGAKKAGTVKGGVAWGGPTEVAAKVNQNLKAFSSLQSYK